MKNRTIEHREFYQPCRHGMATTARYGRARFSRLKGPVGCLFSGPGPFCARAIQGRESFSANVYR